MSRMSYIDVVFDDGTVLAEGRSGKIARRLEHARAHLPAGAKVQLGPEASSTG